MWKPGHGLDELMAYLDALDGKEVHVTVHRPRSRPGRAGAVDRAEIEDIAARVYDRKRHYEARRR